jgi:L-lactate dehydrogenase complex protein LldG
LGRSKEGDIHRRSRDNVRRSVFDLFRARAEAAGAEVRRVPAPAAAVELAAALLEGERVEDAAGARAVWCRGPILGGILDRAARSLRVPGLSFEVTRERAAESRVGLSEVEWALAATGTVAQDATDPALRLASTLPEVHVAFVRTAAIVADLAVLLQAIDPRRARYLAFITGPSRTADIERVLTIGVHGPRRLVVVCVDGAPGPG